MTTIKSVFHLKRRIFLFYRKFITNTYYRTILVSLGKKSIINKPLFFSVGCVHVGDSVFMWPNCRIEGISSFTGKTYTPKIIIGNGVTIQQGLHLTCAEEIVIGGETAIAANVSITDINHIYSDILVPPEKQEIEVLRVNIGSNCKIYNNAVILPGVSLGLHTIVAANSVVRSGLYPNFCVLAGIPAKIIKRYDLATKEWKKTDSVGNFVN